MSQDRRIYSSAGIFIGPSPSTGYHYSLGTTGTNLVTQLIRVQSFNGDFSVNRQNINQFGQLAAISREIIEQPTVPVRCSWLAVNARNESALGFTIDGSVSAFSGIVNGTVDDRNIFNVSAPEDEDLVGNTSADNEFVTEGYGNCFMNSYAVKGAVGGLAEAEIGWEGLNYRVDLGKTSIPIPAVNPVNGVELTNLLCTIPAAVSGIGVAAIRPGEISVAVTADANSQTGVGVNIGTADIQSYEITANLQRESINKLGAPFAVKRKIRFPAEVSSTITMNAKDYLSGSLANLLCNDNTYTITVTLRKPACGGAVGATALIYQLKGAKLDSQPNTLNIGGNKQVTLNFSTQLGSAEDVTRGFFLSGVTN